MKLNAFFYIAAVEN